MKGDLLEEATRALRASGNEARGSDLTRARIMQSLHADKRKRRSRLAFGLPMAAIFVASAAAAQVSGVLPRAIDRVAAVFGADPRPVAPAEPATQPAQPSSPRGLGSANQPAPAEPADLVAAAPTAPEPAEQAIEAAPADSPPADSPPSPPAHSPAAHGSASPPRGSALPAPSAQELPTSAKTPAAPSASSAGAATPAVNPGAEPGTAEPASPEPAADPSHERYLEAHHAHFSAHDYGRALGLWERYLKEFPRGRFATEAQYNRAVCLVRLGRYAAAKAALEPFASGRYAGYRQSEAQALIDAMQPKKP